MSDDAERLARAGEYVLGLMDDAARLAAERDIETDPGFRAAVDNFAARMQSLDATASANPPPADLWEKIAGRIAGVAQAGRPATVVPFAAKQKPSVLWRSVAVAASLVLAAGLGYVAGSTVGTPRPVVMVVLQTPENQPGAVFEAYADNRVRIVPLEDFVVPEGKIMQVWTLYDQAVGPVSLGTLARTEVAVLEAQGLPGPVADQLYEITLEPAPGSPTGKPTGPILVKGFAKRLPD
jgi:anti-sigma-K factor RskA